MEDGGRGENYDLILKTLQNSKIKFEITSSKDPLRIKLPATAKSASILILLLEELRPGGSSVILDNGKTYRVDDDGLQKLRRLVVRSLTSSNVLDQQSEVAPTSVAAAAAIIEEARHYSTPTKIASKEGSTINIQDGKVNDEAEISQVRSTFGFRSQEIALLTITFLAVVAITIGATTWLGLSGKLGQIFVAFILGASVIGVFSLIHRYVDTFRHSVSVTKN